MSILLYLHSHNHPIEAMTYFDSPRKTLREGQYLVHKWYFPIHFRSSGFIARISRLNNTGERQQNAGGCRYCALISLKCYCIVYNHWRGPYHAVSKVQLRTFGHCTIVTRNSDCTIQYVQCTLLTAILKS